MMILTTVFTLCIGFAWADYNSNNNVQFQPHVRRHPEPERPIAQPEQRPLIPEMAVVDKEKVADFFYKWCRGINAKDVDSVLNMYADDVVYINSVSDHVMGKEDFRDVILAEIKNTNGHCFANFSLISGDYYYPHYIGHNYKSDSYGIPRLAIIFDDVIRLKEDGEYEIVLTNIFLVDNHNPPLQNANDYGEVLPQPNGYGQTQEQQFERPKHKKSQH